VTFFWPCGGIDRYFFWGYFLGDLKRLLSIWPEATLAFFAFFFPYSPELCGAPKVAKNDDGYYTGIIIEVMKEAVLLNFRVGIKSILL
jgi:hypothetical protein